MEFDAGLFQGVMKGVVIASLVIFLLSNAIAKFKASAKKQEGFDEFDKILTSSLLLLGMVLGILAIF